MPELPTGTVTFLFTDIEGSTKLLRTLGDRYDAVLAEHRRLLRDAFARHHGHEVGTEGDSFFVTFERASDAVAAALEGQVALQSHDWGEQPVRVRMGLHTGEARTGPDGDYLGMVVHEAARIASAAHGGQVLVSDATRGLVEGSLPEGTDLQDLGEHRLKDLAGPQRLYQLCASGLEDDFQPLRTLEATPNNLPVQPTSFVGREQELAEVAKLLGASRLLTLTGVGGSGKTRLALQIAAEALDEHRDGVWLVELAPLTDPEAVPHTVAGILGIREDEGETKARPILERLVEHLRDRKLLLVLDNCEHLLGAAGRLADHLLRSCEGVTILVTSREGLGIAGEAIWQVPSLGLPDPDGPEELASDAERLFVERAQAVAPSFALTPETRPALAQICRRLDGIPLAIELAASRVRALGVERLAERLDDRFRILTGGSRTALPRQQTLEAAIDWSYKLLDEEEQALFERLSVFAGGFTLEGAEEVCSGDGIDQTDVLDLLSALVDKSLIDPQEGPAGPERYRLLETLRQYARAKLIDSGPAADEIRRRHRDHFAAFATEAEEGFWGLGEEPRTWRSRVEPDRDNLQAALDWSLEHDGSEQAARIATVLGRSWALQGHTTRALALMRTAVDLTGDEVPVERHAMRRIWLDDQLFAVGDEDGSLAQAQKAYELMREVEPSAIKVQVLLSYSGSQTMGVRQDPELSIPLAREALAVARATGEPTLEILALGRLGFSLLWTGRTDEGIQHLREATEIARRLDNDDVVMQAYFELFAMLFAFARREEESQELADEIWSWVNSKDRSAIAPNAYWFLASSFLQSGDWDRAGDCLSRVAERHLEAATKIGFHFYRGTLRWMQGNLGEAAEDTAELRGLDVGRWLHDSYPLLADVACDQGRIEDARSAAKAYVDLAVHASEEPRKAAVLQPLVRAEVDAALATTGTEREGHVRRARDAKEKLDHLLERFPPTQGGPQHELPHTQALLAEAELSRATGPDPDLWREALEHAWMAHTRAYARFRLAEALFATSQRDEGTAELRAAHGEASELGAALVCEQVEELAEREGVRLSDDGR